jgi:hypothetical protein
MFRGLFIGIDHYASDGISWLSCAERDASALHSQFGDTARAALMGKGSTNVRFVSGVVNRENLEALATLLVSGDAKVVIDKV